MRQDDSLRELRKLDQRHESLDRTGSPLMHPTELVDVDVLLRVVRENPRVHPIFEGFSRLGVGLGVFVLGAVFI
jgi:hypothetical protein